MTALAKIKPSKVVPLALSLTRTTPRYVWDASGNLTQVAANQPCFEYDPVTHEPKGLYLNSASVTNLVTDTTMDSWDGSGQRPMTVTSAGDSYFTEAKKISLNSASAYFTEFNVGYYPLGYLNDRTGLFSVFVKYDPNGLRYVTWSSTYMSPYQTLDLKTGNVASPNDDSTNVVEALPGGWYKLTHVKRPNINASSSQFVIAASNSVGGGGNITDDPSPAGSYIIAAWPQCYEFSQQPLVHQLPHPIPTDGTAVTVAGDVCSLASLPIDYGTPGAFVMEWLDTGHPYSGSSFYLTTHSFNARYFYSYSSTWAGDTGDLVSYDNVSNISRSDQDFSIIRRSCLAWDATTMKRSDNGQPVISAPHNGNLGTATAINLMSSSAGYVRRLQFIPSSTMMADSEIIQRATV